MVQIQRLKSNRRSSRTLATLALCASIVCGIWICLNYRGDEFQENSNKSNSKLRMSNNVMNSISFDTPGEKQTDHHISSAAATSQDTTSKTENKLLNAVISCEYKQISDLKEYEAHPKVTDEPDGNQRRHAYDPPQDGVVTLVCCETTVGAMSIAVHKNWAPLGAEHFLDMVKSGYFSSKVALMRCVRNFLCQFGIAGDPKLNKNFKSFPDDPNWLKEGKEFRTNVSTGAKRFARGYFAYAGSGKNSRGNQLIVSLADNKMLGGGSPWEVPFGEVVGKDSYETLSKISTVYGEKGPSQGLLRREGSSENVAKQFPDLDYVTSCMIVDSKDFKSTP